MYKYLIIGGGIAGTTAAETIRKNNSAGSIAIVEDEKYPLYSRLSLYDYIANPEYGDKIFLRSLDQYKEKNIDLMLGEKVVDLNFENKEAVLDSGKIVNFEKLLISTGGAPVDLQVEGGKENIFYYQSLDDAKKIKEKLPDIKKVAVVGASFAAFELAELFRQFDIEVDMFVRKQFLGGSIDEGLQKYIKDVLENKKVNLKLGVDVGKIESGDKGVVIHVGGERYDYDGVAVTVGLGRNFDIFEKAGIKCNKGILTDEYMKANLDDVYAAGDVAEYFDVKEQSHMLSGSWTGAFMQGKIAGENMVGKENTFKMMPTYTCRIFDDQFTFLGPIRGVDEKLEKISRNDLRNGKYTILYLKDDIIKGAAFMNSNEERGVLTALINKKIDVGKYKNDLQNLDFRLENMM